MKLVRVVAVSALAVGLGVSLLAVLIFSGASIPYQDAPPELLAQQASEIQNARILFYIGLAAAAAGGVVLWRSFRRPKR